MLETGLVREVEIIDMNHTGQGLAKINNFVVFISGAITGDIVKIKITDKKKNYALAEIISIIKPSEFRIDSSCPFSKCGGCQAHAYGLQGAVKIQTKQSNQRI